MSQYYFKILPQELNKIVLFNVRRPDCLAHLYDLSESIRKILDDKVFWIEFLEFNDMDIVNLKHHNSLSEWLVCHMKIEMVNVRIEHFFMRIEEDIEEVQKNTYHISYDELIEPYLLYAPEINREELLRIYVIMITKNIISEDDDTHRILGIQLIIENANEFKIKMEYYDNIEIGNQMILSKVYKVSRKSFTIILKRLLYYNVLIIE